MENTLWSKNEVNGTTGQQSVIYYCVIKLKLRHNAEAACEKLSEPLLLS